MHTDLYYKHKTPSEWCTFIIHADLYYKHKTPSEWCTFIMHADLYYKHKTPSQCIALVFTEQYVCRANDIFITKLEI